MADRLLFPSARLYAILGIAGKDEAAMHMPSLTMLMTVYNGMPYLKESVQSVLAQEDKDFDFLVLNNGSTDGSAAYLDERAQKHGQSLPRLRLVHLPENIGRSGVLAKGLALVQTELAAILDADDLAAPERVSVQRRFFSEHPDIDLVGANIIYVDGNGTRIGEQRYPTGHEELRDNLPLFNQFAHSACAFRTGAAREAGGYDPAFPYAQDLALWVAMMRKGGRAAGIDQTLAMVRAHPSQATRDLSLLMVRASDNHRLAEAMLDIPGFASASRQAALVRSALALWRLGRGREALTRAWRAFAEAPLSFFLNPIFYKRLAMRASTP
jgi:glycosyltransferase involved in cell wall biosynthesis